MREIIVQTRGLCKRYGGKLALDHVDMEITKGSIYGFIGKNGAGKTTLMKIVAGLTAPTTGEIELFGTNTPNELRKARARMGGIIEAPALYPELTARGNMIVQKRILGVTDDKMIDETLKLVGLSDTGRKKVKAFSLGMKQRLGLAVGLLGSPDLLMLDEPINGLDPFGIAELRGLLKRLSEERQITIFISSHILSELNQLATHYGIIDNGRLLEQISATELEEKCRQYIRLTVTDAEKAAGVLENTLGVPFTVLPDGVLHVYGMIDSPERVSIALGTAGIGVKSIGTAGWDLETYFLHFGETKEGGPRA